MIPFYIRQGQPMFDHTYFIPKLFITFHIFWLFNKEK